MYLYHGNRQDIVKDKIVPFSKLFNSIENLEEGKKEKKFRTYERKNQKVKFAVLAMRLISVFKALTSSFSAARSMSLS